MKRLALAVLLAFGMCGCLPITVADENASGRHAGPPARAPAHGYRAKHRNHDLEFDSGMGVYVVLGLPGFYYYADRYYRLVNGVWQIGVDVGGPWTVEGSERVPRGLHRHEHDDDDDDDEDKRKGKRERKRKD